MGKHWQCSTTLPYLKGIGGKVVDGGRGESMSKYRYTIVVERDEDGVYIASCPMLQGCYTQGETYEEALENLKDAVRLHIEARRA